MRKKGKDKEGKKEVLNSGEMGLRVHFFCVCVCGQSHSMSGCIVSR